MIHQVSEEMSKPGSQEKTEIRESVRKRKCIKGRRQSNHKGDRNMPIRFN